MKRFALLLCLLTTACATARATQPWPEEFAPVAESGSPSSPARAVHRMALGRLPTYRLREMTLGVSRTVDQILNSTADQDQTVQFQGYPATNTKVDRYAFGDLGNALQNASAKKLQIYAYHGVEIAGGRGSLTPPATATGEESLLVVGSGSTPTIISSGGGGLRIDNASTGTLIAASFAGTFTTAGSPVTVPANTTVCGSAPAGTVTVTGVGAAKPCFVGAGAANNIVPWCKTAANTLTLCFSNITAAALAPPAAATYVMRDLE